MIMIDKDVIGNLICVLTDPQRNPFPHCNLGPNLALDKFNSAIHQDTKVIEVWISACQEWQEKMMEEFWAKGGELSSLQGIYYSSRSPIFLLSFNDVCFVGASRPWISIDSGFCIKGFIPRSERLFCLTSVSFLGRRGRQQRLLTVRIWLFLKYCLAQHGFSLAQFSYQSEGTTVVCRIKMPGDLIFGKYLLSWGSCITKGFSSVKWDYLPHRVVVKVK